MSFLKWIEWNTEKMVFPHPLMGITTKSKSISEHTIEVISLGVLAYKNGYVRSKSGHNNGMSVLKGNVVI